MTPIEKLRLLIHRSGLTAIKLQKAAGYKDGSVLEQIKNNTMPTKEALEPLLVVLKTTYADIITEKVDNWDDLADDVYDSMRVYARFCSNPDQISAVRQAIDEAKFKYNLAGQDLKKAYGIANRLYPQVKRDLGL